MSNLQEQFAGGIFHDSLSDGRTGATITITRWEIVAEPIAGSTLVDGRAAGRFTMPLNRCHIEMGGASGKMIFCRNEDHSLTIFSEERGFSKALENYSQGTITDRLNVLKKQHRSNENRYRFWLLASSVLLLIFLVGGYYGLLAAARVAVRSVPVSVDRQIGRLAMDSLEIENRLPADHPATVMTRQILEKLRPHAAIENMDFEIHVVVDDEENAFALPGGQIVVYTGLIEAVESPEELAGAIAHEMSHATLRHGLQQISQSIGFVAAIQFFVGDLGGLVALGSQITKESLLNSYSRAAETEADLEGARMMHAAGIDPQALADFFSRTADKDRPLGTAMKWLDRHPSDANRVESITQFTQSLPKIEYQKLDMDLQAAKANLR